MISTSGRVEFSTLPDDLSLLEWIEHYQDTNTIHYGCTTGIFFANYDASTKLVV